jgi:hypothetical protein
VLEFCKNLGERIRVKAFCQKILPCVKKLAEDPWEHVRASLATVIMGLSDILGKDLYVKKSAGARWRRLTKKDKAAPPLLTGRAARRILWRTGLFFSPSHYAFFLML